jgi:CheY-like chemotaxis protein
VPEKMVLLCVDDDRDSLFIARLSLELDPEISVFVADSGPEALKFLEDRALQLTCILTDCRMSDMSGPALYAAVRDLPRYREIPIIFLTASVGPEDIKLFKVLGAAGLIPKPYNPIELPRQVRNILKK